MLARPFALQIISRAGGDVVDATGLRLGSIFRIGAEHRWFPNREIGSWRRDELAEIDRLLQQRAQEAPRA